MKTFEKCVDGLYRHPYGAMGWFQAVQLALAALAEERAEARRSAAMNRLAQNDADELAGEPRSYSHWGMHA